MGSEVSFESDELTSESDADADGNLDDFVVEETDENNNDPQDIDGGDSVSGSETTDAGADDESD